MTPARKLDPVTFEILRHRLEEIVHEAYYTMARVSGNAVITEAGDHEESILDAMGNTVLAGGGIVEWTHCLEDGAKFISNEYEENPGIHEGDQFILNSTQIAAVHHMDIQVLKPIFWEGRRVAWMNTAGHNMDVGGITEGGIGLTAVERIQEGLSMRGIKICDRGVVRKDVELTIKHMTRQPDLFMLEMSARMAANNASEKRILATIEEFGLDAFLAIIDELPAYSEGLVRKRLRSLPDGVFTAVEHFESLRPEEGLLHVKCTLTKKGDSLAMDFTGTSPTSKGSQNVALPGARSNAECPFLMMLGYDIPWNHGLWGVIDWTFPEDTIVNPPHTAPVSLNTPAGAGYVLIGVVTDCISQLYLCSDEKQEAYANGSNAFNNPQVHGTDRRGNWFMTMMMENLISGAGALIHRDGDDTSANMWTNKPQVTNLERAEELFPWLYLWRREGVDTGGAGKHRGGTGCCNMFIPWGTPQLGVHNLGMGQRTRLANGLCGGYPAPNVHSYVVRESDVLGLLAAGRMPAEEDDVGGRREPRSTLDSFALAADDVYVVYYGGGGGFGDPLEREPERVAADVRDGYVSEGEARRTYGVALGPDGEPDVAATQEEREQLRRARLDGAELQPPAPPERPPARDWGGVIGVEHSPDGAAYSCLRCGGELAPAGGDWRAGAVRRLEPMSAAQPPDLPSDPQSQLREFCCPHCGVLLEVLNLGLDQPDPVTFRLDDPALAATRDKEGAP